MPRPMRKRRVYQQPGSYHFVGNEPSRGDVVLTLDEFEAVRLCDYVGLEQGEAAKRLPANGFAGSPRHVGFRTDTSILPQREKLSTLS